MAEKVGFEPTCRLPDKRISSAPRYDHFDSYSKFDPHCSSASVPLYRYGFVLYNIRV